MKNLTMAKVNEIFYSIQGEGMDAGQPAVFVRFAGCSMGCTFCDTNFTDYTDMSIDEILGRIAVLFPAVKQKQKLVVITGGEPTEQLSAFFALLWRLVELDYSVAVETNGTNAIACGYLVDTITLSPKIPVEMCGIDKRDVDCLKLLYPYLPGCTPTDYAEYGRVKYIQPIDDENATSNVAGAVKEVLRLGGGWRVGLQLHKILKVR